MCHRGAVSAWMMYSDTMGLWRQLSPPCRRFAASGFFRGWFLAARLLHQHQRSMRLPTCPPWEAVSHFCCFRLVLPLLGQREQGEVCSHCILPAPVPWTHHQPGKKTNQSTRKNHDQSHKKSISLILINSRKYWSLLTLSLSNFQEIKLLNWSFVFFFLIYCWLNGFQPIITISDGSVTFNKK